MRNRLDFKNEIVDGLGCIGAFLLAALLLYWFSVIFHK